MKKRLLLYGLACIIGLSAFKIAEEIKSNTAEVEQEQGVYIFYRSKPLKEYTYLGTVGAPTVVKSFKGSHMVEMMVKRAKEQYPNCTGVIFKEADMWKVDAILFK